MHKTLHKINVLRTAKKNLINLNVSSYVKKTLRRQSVKLRKLVRKMPLKQSVRKLAKRTQRKLVVILVVVKNQIRRNVLALIYLSR